MSSSTPTGKATGLLTALILVPLSMGVVGLTKSHSVAQPSARWTQLVELSNSLAKRIDVADYRRAPLANLMLNPPVKPEPGAQRETSAIPHYRAAANTFDGDRAQAIWFQIMQAERDLGPAPIDSREKLAAEFSELSKDALAKLQRGARAGNAHPAYDFDARERIDTQNLRWLAIAASLEIQAQLQAGDARTATATLCDILQVGIDCANMPYLFDFMAGARVLSAVTETLLLDPAVNAHFPEASLGVIAAALERVDTELSKDVAFADADLVFTMQGLKKAGYAGTKRGPLGESVDIEELLKELAELRTWSQAHQGEAWPELHDELLAYRAAPDTARSMGYALMYHQLRAISLANVRLARAVVEYRMNGDILALASPTLGELEVMNGDRLTDADVNAWAVSPDAARGRWILRYPGLEGEVGPAARAIVNK